ncbi:uncharacterized protein LOC110665414 isoform X1 [Hevea brasiliensis]|uniref:uncharacterized protein LOC110665414 isoform X1 n=1 Tax=Hevea brasiliensis TaxID=3981 RepID=UPI0025E93C84|nr:uncharacterized protein LOC110665414 isoform X1 [Hevea brasiliensis]XP_057984367.1 uncharacterized protein LOC110665414 isoform X1 [Hevea brasiliensis]XP_057984368.1 uncharacterized protein LOC110665414 isoform X1 [Hevea brasiliensis]
MRKDALSPPLQNGQQYSKQSRLYLPPLDDPKLHQQQELEEEEEDRYPTCHKKKMEMLKQNKTRNENSKPKRSNQRKFLESQSSGAGDERLDTRGLEFGDFKILSVPSGGCISRLYIDSLFRGSYLSLWSFQTFMKMCNAQDT